MLERVWRKGNLLTLLVGTQWKQWETLFWGTPKLDGDYSHEIKRCLLLERKAMTNLWVSEWVKSLSHVRLFATPWTAAHQAPPSMGFSRQEYWSGLPFPSPGDLPDPGIEPRSPTLQSEALNSEPPGKPIYYKGRLLIFKVNIKLLN